MGVWQQTGPLTYKLNHYAFGGNTYPPGTPNGVVGDPDRPHAHHGKSMKVSADGTHYIGNGTFTLVAHQPNGEAYAAFTGLLTGTRITLERQWPTFSNHPTTAQG